VKRRPAAGAAALFVVALAARAAAQPAVAAAPPPFTEAIAVEIAVVGSAATFAWVRELVGVQGGGAGGAVRWARLDRFEARDVLVAGAPGGGARAAALGCWIDLSDPRRARIYFVARARDRFLLRDVELSGRFDEVDRTALAEVIRLSLSALLDGAAAGMPRADAERVLATRAGDAATAPAGAGGAAVARPAPPPAAPLPLVVAPPGPSVPAPDGRPGLAAGAFYAVQAFAAGHAPVGGPGVAASLPVARARAAGQVVAWLSGQAQLPVIADGDLAGVRLTSLAARAGAGALWPVGRARPARLTVELRAGAGVDAVLVAPRAGTGGAPAALTPPRWTADLVVTAAVGAGVAIGRRARVAALLFADAGVAPAAVHYDVRAGAETTTVVAPYRVRPGVALALSFSLGAGAP
jgi:hypothetical protein